MLEEESASSPHGVRVMRYLSHSNLGWWLGAAVAGLEWGSGIGALLADALALGIESLSIRLQVLVDDRAAARFILSGIDGIDLQLANLPLGGRA